MGPLTVKEVHQKATEAQLLVQAAVPATALAGWTESTELLRMAMEVLLRAMEVPLMASAVHGWVDPKVTWGRTATVAESEEASAEQRCWSRFG